MTNKDQSKYPYDRSEYVVMPPIRKTEAGTLTTEPQNVDWDGLYKIRDKCSGRVLDKLNHWLYANDPRKAGNNPVEQTPPPIDVESLKREVCEKYACDIEVETAEVRGIIRMLIDHLASAGYLRAPLPRIEGLKEAIEWQDGKYGFYEYNDAFGHFPQVATDEAARAYLKLQGGD